MSSLFAVLALLGVFLGPPLHSQPPATDTVNDSPQAVVLAVDTSDSMWGAPLTQAQAAIRAFLDELPATTPVALVSFDQQARIVQPFTADRTALAQALADLEPGGVSALYDGALLAVQLAANSGAAAPTVILLSDGSETRGQSQAARNAAAQTARDNGVTVHTVSLGASADRAYLGDLAQLSGGSPYSAADPGALARTYASLSETLSPDRNALPDLGTVAARPLTGTTLRQSDPDGDAVSQVNDQTTDTAGAGTGVIPPLAGRLDDTAADPVPVIPPQAAAVDPSSNTPQLGAIVLAVDVSDSMWGAPLNGVKTAARQFVTAIDGAAPIGLVTYGNDARVSQSLTTDSGQLLAAIDAWQPGGVTALYDGAALAVALAAQSETPGRRIVVLLSDGGEYGGQSAAARDDALLDAQANGVEIISVGLGFGADTVYLGDLANGSGGRLIEAAAAGDLSGLYRELAAALVTPDAPTPDTVAGVTAPDVIAPLSAQSEPETVSLGIEAGLGEITLPDSIAPLNEDIMALDLGAGSASDNVTTSGLSDTVAEPDALTPDDLSSETVTVFNPITPITVAVDQALGIVRAELALNGQTLTTFDGDGPYRYDLDTSRLLSGDYQLTLTARNDRGVTTVSTLNFSVAQPTQLPRTGGLAGVDTVSLEPGGGAGLNVTTADSAAPRVLLVEGQALENDLALTFNSEDGLALDASAQPHLAAQPETLADILMRPAQLIPEPIRAALTHQNPQLAMFVIIAMTIILLPQGIFTIYWMTYTWVKPERGEESRSPREFYEPQFSFTAIVPARKEELVIYNTVRTVHNINYPDHLKEVIIPIRDDGEDDDTISEVKRAIADIRREYVAAGKEYPDNIKLVTFTDGPKNKPNGLNRSHQVATKDVVCIFDAEDSPHADIYNVVNTVMLRDNADVVQSGVQLMNFETNWFSALNVLEYFFWFKSGLHAFTHEMHVTPLGGNTVFFKTSWLDRLAEEDKLNTDQGYAWDQGCLTEDADVGFRLTRMGASIQIVYDAEHATQEETPDSPEQFIKQRTRWCQGFYEIFFKGEWLALPTWKQRITAIYILLNSVLQASIVFFLPLGIFIALTQRIAVPIALLSYIPIYLLLTQLVINMMGIREFTLAYGKKLPLGFRLKMLIFYYPFQLMLSVSAMRAIVRFLQGSNSWEKTAHSNLHRDAAPAGGAA